MDLRPVFDAFYDRLVLRDVAGKVVPGSILILSLVVGAFGFEATTAWLPKMSFPLWVLLFGVSWLIAFALQYIGEKLHLLRTYPRDTDVKQAGKIAFALRYIGKKLRRLKTHPRDSDAKPEETWTDRKSFYPWLAKFHDLASTEQKVHAERINVIREACGNTAVSVALSCLLLLVSLRIRGNLSSLFFLFFTVAVVIAFSLWRMHVTHVDRYGEFVKRTVNFRKKNQKRQEGDTSEHST